MDSDDLLDRYLNEVGLEPVDLGNRTTEYVPFAIQAFSRDNHLYGVPFALENHRVCAEYPVWSRICRPPGMTCCKISVSPPGERRG